MASQAALSSLQAAFPSGFAFRKAVGGEQILGCPQGGLAPIRAATKIVPKKVAPSKKIAGTQKISTGTQKAAGKGTQIKNAAGAAVNGAARKAIKVVEVFGPKETKGLIRDKRDVDGNVKVLSRVQELRLLTKAEESGLLSTLEGLGFTLSTIESLGLLSKAEELGLLGAVTDKKLPGTLLLASLVILAAGPAIVYFGPEDSSAIVIAEYVVAALTVAGGAALFGASKLVKALQS